MSDATPDEYFEGMWATGDDPWNHGSRWYETRKYDLTVAALLRPRYGTAFEPGCGAGFLTERLSACCDRVLAVERAQRGVEATRQRCAGASNVEVAIARLPDDWPDEPLDLLVLSEVLYYLDDDGLGVVLDRCADHRRTGGEIVAVHYRHEVSEHVRLGDEVHDRLRAVLGSPAASHVEDAFVLDVFGDATSA